MTDPVLQRLDDIADDIAEVKQELRPVREFYLQATGILAAIRWLGSGTVILVAAAVVWFVIR